VQTVPKDLFEKAKISESTLPPRTNYRRQGVSLSTDENALKSSSMLSGADAVPLSRRRMVISLRQPGEAKWLKRTKLPPRWKIDSASVRDQIAD